jgi:hypothetical protein
MKGGDGWLNYEDFYNLTNTDKIKPNDDVLVRPVDGEEVIEKYIYADEDDGNYVFTFSSDGLSKFYECCKEEEDEVVEFKQLCSKAPQPGGGKRQKRVSH